MRVGFMTIIQGVEGEFIRFLSNVLIYKSINGAEKKRVLKNVLMDNLCQNSK